MLLLKKQNHELFPLFIDYGQLSREKEWTACQSICNYLGLKPHRIDVSGFGQSIKSGITDSTLDIEEKAFLPTRNLLFLTLAGAYGYTNSVNIIAIGLLSNPIFPDQTREFIRNAQRAISISLGAEVEILAPTISLSKIDTLGLARKYKLPLDLTYSCHSGNSEPCGRCISCKERISAEKYLGGKHTAANS
jgi:7-cyano-7-deazaguanine synthase